MTDKKIEITKVNNGVYWIGIPEAKLKILCGCPADTVKHLKKRGLIDKTEKNGVFYETGPNAILLSDVLLQNGYVSNLAEFPLLQMLYSQGMLIPNHPGNTGEKPLLIGSEQQIKAQMEYFYRGNYGLISRDEILAAGASEDMADKIMHIKLRFAFGQMKPSHELVNQLILNDEKTEIRKGVFIKRKDVNIFEITYEDQSAVVDLTLRSKEYYEPPYYLGYHKLSREYFSVVHTGEGDAWDINRPCMASILMYQGKIYLIDAGPDLMTTMNALGISVNEVAGIFHTHAHDDHFAGLNSFVRSDHRIKYFASSIVRASVAKKLCALMSLEEESFERFFEVHDLELDKWNNIDGLEVMPLLSPHPVETNIFYFRAFWADRYCSYAHLADVASFQVLENNVFKLKDGETDYSLFLDKVKKDYLTPADIKKIDVGGGLIHGEAEDFAKDPTPKILLAHISRPLTQREKQIGTFAPFGSIDAIAETHQNFLRSFAHDYLKFYFPNVPKFEIDALLNCPIVSMNAGDTLFRKGSRYTHVYLLLTGAVELVYPDIGVENSLSAGSLVGLYIDDEDVNAKSTARASCYITALQIPVEMYLIFVNKYRLIEDFNQMEESVFVLGNTWLFCENISLPVYIKIAQLIKKQRFNKGEKFAIAEESNLYVIKQGQAALLTANGSIIENLKKGDFFGAENIFSKKKNTVEIFLLEDSELYQIPMETVLNIPIVYWKMLEVANKRNKFL